MHYIMVMRDGRFWLVGPFETKDARIAYTDANWTLDHDPRWQALELSDARAPVTLISPERAAVSDEYSLMTAA